MTRHLSWKTKIILVLMTGLPLGCTMELMQGQEAGNQALFEIKCSRCHSSKIVDAKTKNCAGWRATVERMARISPSFISPPDIMRISDYLCRLTGGGEPSTSAD